MDKDLEVSESWVDDMIHVRARLLLHTCHNRVLCYGAAATERDRNNPNYCWNLRRVVSVQITTRVPPGPAFNWLCKNPDGAFNELLCTDQSICVHVHADSRSTTICTGWLVEDAHYPAQQNIGGLHHCVPKVHHCCVPTQHWWLIITIHY